MRNERSRTLFYRRIAWIDGAGGDMAQLLRQAHNVLTATAERTFPYSDGEILGLRTESKGDDWCCHVAAYIPEQPTSLVPFPSNEDGQDTSQHPPPENHNYMHGDIFLVLRGNHVVLCPSGAREAAAISYISSILSKVGQQELLNKYSVEPIADIDKLQLLQKEGVKKISLNATLYEASKEYAERQTTRMTLLHSAAEEFLALFGQDQDEQLMDLSDKENLTVRLEVSFDSRKKGGEVGKRRIEAAAQKLVEDGEGQGFTIVTGENKTLTAGEIRLSKRIRLPTHGNSVWRAEAWAALVEYLDELKDSGTLEQ